MAREQDIFQLPFRITEWSEEMLVALDRNLKEIERVVSQLQMYEKLIGREVNEKVEKVGITEEGLIPTSQLTEKLVGLENDLQLANQAVDNAKLAVAAVLEDNLGDEVVSADKIAANAVIAAKIEANAVVADHIMAGQLTSDHISADGITANKITSGQILTHLVQVSDEDGYVLFTGDGIKVFDSGANLRTHLGQYATGEYGLLVLGGEIYGSKIRTNQPDDTTYIEMVNQNIRAVVSGDKAIEMGEWFGGSIQFYSENTEMAVFYTTPGGLYMRGRDKGVQIRSPDLHHSMEFYDGLCDIYYNVVWINGELQVDDLYVSGSKNALVETENYGERALQARESPEAKFIDEGMGTLKTGKGIVYLDPIFLETIEEHSQHPWLIHLTPYGPFNLYIKNIGSNYFEVASVDENAEGSFAWTLSAVRKGYAERFKQPLSAMKEEDIEEYLHSGWEDDLLERD